MKVQLVGGPQDGDEVEVTEGIQTLHVPVIQLDAPIGGPYEVSVYQRRGSIYVYEGAR